MCLIGVCCSTSKVAELSYGCWEGMGHGIALRMAGARAEPAWGKCAS